jgi:hypothetical protein
MDYEKEVLDDAKDFIREHKEMIVEALENRGDFDCNDMDGLDEAWNQEVVDRSYSLTDAAVILDNCHNEESDYGLWEGREPEEAIESKAALSYANDMWEQCVDLFKEIEARFQDLIGESPDSEESDLAKQAFDEVVEEWERDEIKPITEGGPEEKPLIQEWLRLNEKAGMFGGYPLGQSYIDARCGSGHGMPEVKEFVDFDHEMARKCPWLAGNYKQVVQQRLDYLVNDVRACKEPTNYGLINVRFPIDKDNLAFPIEDSKEYRSLIVDAILKDGRLTNEHIRAIANELRIAVG